MSTMDVRPGMLVRPKRLPTPRQGRAFLLTPRYKSPRGPTIGFPIPCPFLAPAVSASVSPLSPPCKISRKKYSALSARSAPHAMRPSWKLRLRSSSPPTPGFRTHSQNGIIGLLQWYRLTSPETKIEIRSVGEYLNCGFGGPTS